MAQDLLKRYAEAQGMFGLTPWSINPETSTSSKAALSLNERYTPKQANETFDIVRNLPEVQAQQSGIDDLESELTNLKNRPRQNENTWIKPLLALADSETGSKLMAGYTEPEENKKRDETIMRYQDAIANRKKQVVDSLIGSLGKFKSGEGMLTNVDASKFNPNEPLADLVKAEAAVNKPRGKGGAADKPTEFDKKIDKDLAEYQAKGGPQNLTGNIQDLDRAIVAFEDSVKNGKNITGKAEALKQLGYGIGGGATESKQLMDSLSKITVTELKSIFPGALSNEEGRKWESLNFDIGNSDKENLRRAMEKRKILTSVKNRSDALTKHGQENKGKYKGFDFGKNYAEEYVSPEAKTAAPAAGKSKKTSEIEW